MRGIGLSKLAVSAALLVVGTSAHAQDNVKQPAVRARVVQRAAKLAPPASPAEQTSRESEVMQRIRNALAPHGEWLKQARYGEVWRPRSIDQRFVPYLTDGKWVNTGTNERAWKSDQPWGELTMHYGNWVWTRETGWSWLPGTEYAPAHVVWRVGEQYIGWVPRSPMRYWIEDAPVRQAQGGLPFWFVPKQHLFDPKLRERLVSDRDAVTELMKHSSLEEQAAPPAAPQAAATPQQDVTKALEALERSNGTAKDKDKVVGPAPMKLEGTNLPAPVRRAQPIVQKRIEAPRRYCWFTNTWPRERRCRFR